MTNSTDRPVTTVLCILLMTHLSLWTGCTVSVSGGGAGGGGGGKPGSGSLTLSSSSVAPGGLVTVSHPGISAGSIIEVEFSGPNGFAVTVEGVDTQNGSTRIAAPPLMDLTTGQTSAGQVSVSVKGLTGQASLFIDDLPQVENLEPGTIVVFYLQTTIEELQAVRVDLAQIEADFPGAVTGTSGLVLIDEQIRDLQATIAQLENGQPITVELPGGGQATLTTADLQFADRWLASMLDGLQQAALNSPAGKRMLADPELKGLLSLRTTSECLQLAQEGASGQAVRDCFGEVVGDLRRFAGRGTNLGATAVTALGLGLAVFAGPEIALLGGVVAVISFTAGTVNAMVLGQNTDAFLNNDGEDFSLGQEIISQVGRFGFSVFTFLPSVAVSINDILSGAKTEKCLAEQQPDRRFQPDPNVAAFCEFDPSAGGGASGGDSPTTGTFNTTFVSTTGGVLTADASAAQISLSGSPSFPTISWTVGPLQQLHLIEDGQSGGFLYAVISNVEDDAEGDTVVTPISSPVTYGDYSSSDLMRFPDAPGFSVPSVAPALRADGTTYAVTVVTLAGQTASITFTIN
ncbi:MAG: hypothetical protein ACE5GE_14020 [Phycisphaerae bacterium]